MSKITRYEGLTPCTSRLSKRLLVRGLYMPLLVPYKECGRTSQVKIDIPFAYISLESTLSQVQCFESSFWVLACRHLWKGYSMHQPHGWDASWETSQYILGKSFVVAVVCSSQGLLPETQRLEASILQETPGISC